MEPSTTQPNLTDGTFAARPYSMLRKPAESLTCASVPSQASGAGRPPASRAVKPALSFAASAQTSVVRAACGSR